MEKYIKSEQNNVKYPIFTQKFNPRYLLDKKKRNSKNLFSFEILRWRVY